MSGFFVGNLWSVILIYVFKFKLVSTSIMVCMYQLYGVVAAMSQTMVMVGPAAISGGGSGQIHSAIWQVIVHIHLCI